MLDFLYVTEQDLHPSKAGAFDQKSVGFNYVLGRGTEPYRADYAQYQNRQKDRFRHIKSLLQNAY